MKISLPIALAISLSLASCSSDPLPEFTRSFALEDSIPSQSLSFALEDTALEEDVDTLSFHADPWDGVDVGVDL